MATTLHRRPRQPELATILKVMARIWLRGECRAPSVCSKARKRFAETGERSKLAPWPGGKGRRLEEVLVQAGVEFIDEEGAIGVRLLQPAKPGAHKVKMR